MSNDISLPPEFGQGAFGGDADMELIEKQGETIRTLDRLLKDADSRLSEQGVELAKVQAKLENVREAECDTCGRALPPDEDCHSCECGKLQVKLAAERKVVAQWRGICEQQVEKLEAAESVLQTRNDQLYDVQRQLQAVQGEVVAMKEALLGANWIIGKLAPHEAVAIQIRGYKVSAEDVATGARYRKMIDAALSGSACQAYAERLNELGWLVKTQAWPEWVPSPHYRVDTIWWGVSEEERLASPGRHHSASSSDSLEKAVFDVALQIAKSMEKEGGDAPCSHVNPRT